jgi:hypothetical protein
MNAIANLRTLREAGISENQAEAIVSVVEQSGEAGGLKKWMVENFASKKDLAEVETRITVRLFAAGLSIAGIVLAGVYFLLSQSAR